MSEVQVQLDPWEAVFHHAPCGLIYLNAQGAVRALNAAALRLLDKAGEEECRGQSLTDLVPVWKDTEFYASLPSLLSAQTTFQAIEFKVPGPHKRQFSIYATHVPDEVGRVRGVLLALVESAQVEQLERRLQRSEYQASIGKLARGIAHELNSPLDGVMRYTHLALEHVPEDSPVHQYLMHVKEGLDRMVRAVKAFLEYSRQVTTPTERAADVNRLIEDVLLLVQHRARFQQVTIDRQYSHNLPNVTDAGIQHAVANVVKNAFDAMPKGGVLTIKTIQHQRWVRIDITDTGPGIPEEIRSRIFEPFFSTKPIHQGNGLGLIIAREAVERSGGSIECSSQVGVGTTFRIQLPISEGEHVGHGA